MKLLQSLVLLVAFLCILWGPAVVIARRQMRRGHYGGARHLRFILPAQVVLVLALAATGEWIDAANPAAMLVSVVAASSALGALAVTALGR